MLGQGGLALADGDSHDGPYAGQDEEGDVPECPRWFRLERVSDQKGSIEADVGGGSKEDYGDPVERLLSGASSVPGTCRRAPELGYAR